MKPRAVNHLVHALQQAEVSPLEHVLKQADQLQQWNTQLKRQLPAALAASVRLCNIRKNGVAVIAVASQSIASQVYLQQKLLLETLQKLQLPVTRVSFRVRPPLEAETGELRALPSLWQREPNKTTGD